MFQNKPMYTIYGIYFLTQQRLVLRGVLLSLNINLWYSQPVERRAIIQAQAGILKPKKCK